MKRLLKIFLAFILFSSSVVGQNSVIQNKIFSEINALRKNPNGYYKKYKSFFDKDKNAIIFFKHAIPVFSLAWSDKLFQAAKDESLSNYKGNTDKYTNGYCGSAGFGGSSSTEDSTDLNIIFENYTTLLSTDFHAIGIYAEKKEELYGKSKYKMLTSYAFIGTDCKVKSQSYSFPGKKVIIDSTTVDFVKINTAANANYLIENEKIMIREINFARHYPNIYAQIISNWLVAKKDELTYNDYIAGQEIVDILSKMKTLNCLLPDNRLMSSAKKHGLDMAKRGYTGHTGSDNSSPFDRIKKVLGSSYLDGSENLVGGSSPRESVITLLIDGGIGSRGHRENIINPNWTHVACFLAGKIGDTPFNYVQNFAKIK
ncbi:MAG: CAP domain-containing protein [Bacteroidia bacterium]